jgi:AcrR family transcriptional regulator
LRLAVGLTERTFFRHFSDKREVLFYGQHLLVQAFLAGVDTASPGARVRDRVDTVDPPGRATISRRRRSRRPARTADTDRAGDRVTQNPVSVLSSP